MRSVRFVKTGKRNPCYHMLVKIRQTRCFKLPQVSNGCQRGWPGRGNIQDAYMASLDLSCDGVGDVRNNIAPLSRHLRAVIRNKATAQGKELQGK